MIGKGRWGWRACSWGLKTRLRGRVEIERSGEGGELNAARPALNSRGRGYTAGLGTAERPGRVGCLARWGSGYEVGDGGWGRAKE